MKSRISEVQIVVIFLIILDYERKVNVVTSLNTSCEINRPLCVSVCLCGNACEAQRLNAPSEAPRGIEPATHFQSLEVGDGKGMRVLDSGGETEKLHDRSQDSVKKIIK